MNVVLVYVIVDLATSKVISEKKTFSRKAAVCAYKFCSLEAKLLILGHR